MVHVLIIHMLTSVLLSHGLGPSKDNWKKMDLYAMLRVCLQGYVMASQLLSFSPLSLTLYFIYIMKGCKIFPLMDTAYQGFATGDVEDDAWAVREMVCEGFGMYICSSILLKISASTVSNLIM